MSAVARRYFMRAEEALLRGEIDGAREDLRAALEVAPYFVSARVNYASVLARCGEAPRAADLLREGIAGEERAGRPASRSTIGLLRALGEVLIAGNDYRGAEQAFSRAAEAGRSAGLPPGDVAGRLARLRAKTGRFSEAFEQLLIAARASDRR